MNNNHTNPKERLQGTPKVTQLLEEFPMASHTPMEVLKKLKRISNHTFLLESAENGKRGGRYSFLGYDPRIRISCKDGKIQQDGVTYESAHPSKYIRQLLEEYRGERREGLPPFTGGLVGYFSYEYQKYVEPGALRKQLETEAIDTEGFQDLDLMLFHKVIAFDHVQEKILCITNIKVADGEAGYRRGMMELEELRCIIRGVDSEEGIPGDAGRRFMEMEEEPEGRALGQPEALFSQEAYCQMVEKAKKHIVEGDIFQIVLSNRWEVPYTGSLTAVYERMKTINPSPYMFHFCGTDMEVAGASPETLVKLENGVLHTYPLAGTRRRGRDAAEDQALEEELLGDEKELAEHHMLVDLGRNDLGKVSAFGTVEVEELRKIHRFSHVMHIGSTVRGELREDKDALDAVEAVLPAGTLSGAPKIRASQLICSLEGNKRGIYGGAFGYIDFTGNMDLCIGIRLVYKKGDKAYVRSGAGIVADSIPEKEYEECRNKGMASFAALFPEEEDRT